MMRLTKKEQKKMKDTKYGNAIFEPQVLAGDPLSPDSEFGTCWHSLPSVHDNIIDGQASPVAHLQEAKMLKRICNQSYNTE